MAKLVVCAVFDSAVQAYLRPIFVPKSAAAVRSFIDEVKREGEGNPLAAHPEDYHLSYLADFDEDTGAFSPPEGGVQVLLRGKDVQ